MGTYVFHTFIFSLIHLQNAFVMTIYMTSIALEVINKRNVISIARSYPLLYYVIYLSEITLILRD